MKVMYGIFTSSGAMFGNTPVVLSLRGIPSTPAIAPFAGISVANPSTSILAQPPNERITYTLNYLNKQSILRRLKRCRHERMWGHLTRSKFQKPCNTNRRNQPTSMRMSTRRNTEKSITTGIIHTTLRTHKCGTRNLSRIYTYTIIKVLGQEARLVRCPHDHLLHQSEERRVG